MPSSRVYSDDLEDMVKEHRRSADAVERIETHIGRIADSFERLADAFIAKLESEGH